MKRDDYFDRFGRNNDLVRSGDCPSEVSGKRYVSTSRKLGARKFVQMD